MRQRARRITTPTHKAKQTAGSRVKVKAVGLAQERSLVNEPKTRFAIVMTTSASSAVRRQAVSQAQLNLRLIMHGQNPGAGTTRKTTAKTLAVHVTAKRVLRRRTST